VTPAGCGGCPDPAGTKGTSLHQGKHTPGVQINIPLLNSNRVYENNLNKRSFKKMTKKNNKGSMNQSSPEKGNYYAEFSSEHLSGDNSKGNKRNKDQKDKTELHD
jgi:hypothetical protein